MTFPFEPPNSSGDYPDKLRQRIAEDAARYVRDGKDFTQAILLAARRVARGWVPSDRLPGYKEILRAINSAHTRSLDRLETLRELVQMLESVKQDPARHPEGDLLEHSLQVFDRVYRERPFDEELLTAALVHDVGKMFDRNNSIRAAVEALQDLITPRTQWFIEQLPVAMSLHEGVLGARARARLELHPDCEDLQLLAESKRRGCVRGYDTPTLEQAFEKLRELAAEDNPPSG